MDVLKNTLVKRKNIIAEPRDCEASTQVVPSKASRFYKIRKKVLVYFSLSEKPFSLPGVIEFDESLM